MQIERHYTHGHVKYTAGVGDGLGVGAGVPAHAAHMEAHSYDVQAELLGSLQQTPAALEGGSKLHTQRTHGV